MTALIQVLRYIGISSSDLLTYAGTAGMLLLLALLASFVPARR